MIISYLLSLITLHVMVAIVAGAHVLLYKRDSRSALGWLGLIVLFPIAGALLYTLFGVNRVRRKARRLSLLVEPEGGRSRTGPLPAGGASLRNVGYSITGNGLTPGNSVTTYFNGEQAFPAMLQAIASAGHEVLLSSYIFDNDRTGGQFVEALAAAQKRGVRVYVLLDDVGIRYSFPTILHQMKRHGISCKRFMPLRLLPPSLSINLRNHRKLLIVDRAVSFAGGMNIGDRQLINGPSPFRASDLHFCFEGPITTALSEQFLEDWKFSGGGEIPVLQPGWTPAGSAHCRMISDGPDETLDSLQLVIMGGIGRARTHVLIMTPYFLPDRAMIACLKSAAISGVDVRVIVPLKNNWPAVQWALQHSGAELLAAGVRILQRPPPFAHSKCILIDQDYTLIGSANLDPRSLRLNFELGIEIFDAGLNSALTAHFREIEQFSLPMTTRSLNNRKIPARLRDSAAAMFAPYL